MTPAEVRTYLNKKRLESLEDSLEDFEAAIAAKCDPAMLGGIIGKLQGSIEVACAYLPEETEGV